MTANSAPPSSVNTGMLGALWVLYGIVRLVVGAILIVESAVATVMFGALLMRVANPFFFMGVFHFLYAVVIVITFISGILGVLSGLALLTRGSSARSLPVLASFFSLCDLPLGTTLGTYTMIVFLR
jgi:hypothetical protein